MIRSLIRSRAIRAALVLGFITIQNVPTLSAAEGDAVFSVSPDSAASLLIPALQGAQRTIDMNIYSISNKNIIALLGEKAKQGVKITVLIEGQPAGGLNAGAKAAIDSLQQTLVSQGKGNAKLFVMTSNQGENKRRYVYDHAKYVVVDGAKIVVSSENFTNSAFPQGTQYVGGSRGWQVALENRALASELGRIFDIDTDPSNADVVPYEKVKWEVKPPAGSSGGTIPTDPRTVQQFPAGTGKVKNAQLCASPKSLDCIVQFIRSAKKSLVAEHLSLPLYWGGYQNQEQKLNPLIQEFIDAAQRGVKVRVLVNDEASFGGGAQVAALGDGDVTKLKNSDTVRWIQQYAASHKLSLDAALFDAKAVQVNYVHNKSMVADGKRAFISSINGTDNSVMNNREMAVAIDSGDAGKFYQQVFDFDWSKRKQPQPVK